MGERREREKRDGHEREDEAGDGREEGKERVKVG